MPHFLCAELSQHTVFLHSNTVVNCCKVQRRLTSVRMATIALIRATVLDEASDKNPSL